ncbi:lipopolysaccharide-induced tumor necrosis factor-alpha factor homolog [Stigmatopora argus]
MEPPTYNEATLPRCVASVGEHDDCPPPSYYASIAQSSDPPPYQETNPHPVLMPDLLSIPHNSPVSVHLTPLDAVVSQPQAGETATIGNLLTSPGSVQCPHCQKDVETKIKHIPAKGAFALCCVMAFSGLVCGFCLIPFMFPDFWDVHHYCPDCGKHLHVHHKS